MPLRDQRDPLCGRFATESVVVFNGDVLTRVDLAAVRGTTASARQATIVLTPVDPRAYGW